VKRGLAARIKERLFSTQGLFRLDDVGKKFPGFKHIVSDELERRFEEMMHSYSLDSEEVRELMLQEEVYISGSVVLAVIKAREFEAGDLDFYVGLRSAGKMYRFLQEADGWMYSRAGEEGSGRRRREYCQLPHVVDIWYYTNKETGKIINVIVTANV
jgi:hypothetical protein